MGSYVAHQNFPFPIAQFHFSANINTDSQLWREDAFALWCVGGRAVAWGDACEGGDTSTVEWKLRSVQHIYSTKVSFAAILTDGHLVTWGSSENGGISDEVQDLLTKVVGIQAAAFAFAAITSEGQVVSWGEAESGEPVER